MFAPKVPDGYEAKGLWRVAWWFAVGDLPVGEHRRPAKWWWWAASATCGLFVAAVVVGIAVTLILSLL